MDELERLWPDPDRREGALYRLAHSIGATDELRDWLTPRELRVLAAMSHGLVRADVATILGFSLDTVMVDLKHARRILRAKNTAHACCEALRRGLIS